MALRDDALLFHVHSSSAMPSGFRKSSGNHVKLSRASIRKVMLKLVKVRMVEEVWVAEQSEVAAMGTGCSCDRKVSLMHFPAFGNALIVYFSIFQHYTKAVTLPSPQNHMPNGRLGLYSS